MKEEEEEVVVEEEEEEERQSNETPTGHTEEEKEEEEEDLLTVSLERCPPGTQLGVRLGEEECSTGEEEGMGVFIAEVQEGGAVAADGRLAAMDRLVLVNGQDVQSCGVRRASELIQVSRVISDPFSIRVHRVPPVLVSTYWWRCRISSSLCACNNGQERREHLGEGVEGRRRDVKEHQRFFHDNSGQREKKAIKEPPTQRRRKEEEEEEGVRP